jgi:hypothetical protein
MVGTQRHRRGRILRNRLWTCFTTMTTPVVPFVSPFAGYLRRNLRRDSPRFSLRSATSSVILSAIALGKSANNRKQAPTPAEIGRREIVAVASVALKTPVFIGVFANGFQDSLRPSHSIFCKIPNVFAPFTRKCQGECHFERHRDLFLTNSRLASVTRTAFFLDIF